MFTKKNNIIHIDSEIGNVVDLDTFIENNRNSVFSFSKYKRVFTPYEESKKFCDESMFEDTIRGYILKAIDLGYDYLLEINRVSIDFDGSIKKLGVKEYLHLSDCSMSLFEDSEEDNIE